MRFGASDINGSEIEVVLNFYGKWLACLHACLAIITTYMQAVANQQTFKKGVNIGVIPRRIKPGIPTCNKSKKRNRTEIQKENSIIQMRDDENNVLTRVGFEPTPRPFGPRNQLVIGIKGLKLLNVAP